MTTRTISPVYLWIYTFLIIGIFSCASCQKTSWGEDLIMEDEFRTPPELDGPLKNESLSEGEVLERKMQWASFITAKIFCENQSARDEVAEQLLETQTDHISISQLIVSAEHTPVFKRHFIDLVYYYRLVISSNGRPNHNEVIPPPSSPSLLELLSSPSPTIFSTLESAEVDAYINFLTQENCTELFFLNQLRNEDDSYLSTAHPMVEGGAENYSFLRSCGDCTLGGVCVKEMTIDDRQVDAEYEIIVCRPYRLTNGSACLYPQFEGIDFTLFLNH